MLIYIIPRYIDGMGDCCRVKRQGGEVLLPKKLSTVFKDVFREYCTDFSAIRKITMDILKQKILNPIYVSAREIMIPIKVRQPLFKGDCCHGYVNIFEIRKVFNKEILLMSGEKIPFLDTKRTIQRRERMAEFLEERMVELVKVRFSNGFDRNKMIGEEREKIHGVQRELDLGIGIGGIFGRGCGQESRQESRLESWQESGIEPELVKEVGFGSEPYPSMPTVVEEYILNLVYWAIENKFANNEAIAMNERSCKQ